MSTLTLKWNNDFSYGEVVLPSSKSLCNRAYIIQSLCKEQFHIHHISPSDDSRNLANLLSFTTDHMDVGAAGTNMRFLISLLAIRPGNYILTGNERLNDRPIRELVDCLQSLGAEISYLKKEGYPPLEITGQMLQGGEIKIDGSISSQFISSLLLVAPCLSKGLKIEILNNVVSKPYIEMTLELMKYFGIEYSMNKNTIEIKPQNYQAKNYEVEPDWSAAAFWYAFIANSKKGTRLFFKGLSFKSLQGDRLVSRYFQLFGIDSTETGGGIQIEKTGEASDRIDLSLLNEPDLFPALAFSCAALRIPSSFTGLQTLNLKESKRIDCIKKELEKTGAVCESGIDFFKITDYQTMPDQLYFDTYGDHRIAMAASIFLTTGKPVLIKDPEVVSKSYPGFWEALKNIRIANIY